ncbi:MAG: cupin domain-containing protein [Deltaproteobacteria bacterium]
MTAAISQRGMTWFERFFLEGWSGEPFVARGVAEDLIGPAVQRDQFALLSKTVERLDPGRVRSDGQGTIFAQEVDAACPRLADIADAPQRFGPSNRVWFDGVCAPDTSGIGCHFDDSDNLVLQQTGVKRWRIYSPENVPEEQLRQRMLGKGEASRWDPGQHPFREYLLGPGDVLYIPIFWPHWGISEGPSVSLSLVFNTSSPLAAYGERVREALAAEAHWWRPLSLQRRAAVRTDVPASSLPRLEVALAASFQAATFRQNLQRALARGESEPARPLLRKKVKSAPIAGKLIKSLSSARLPPLAVESCVHPELEDNRLLRKYAGRPLLRRLLLAVDESLELLPWANRASVILALEALQRLPVSRLLQAVTRPTLQAWLRALEQQQSDAEARGRLLTWLPTLLVGELLRGDALRANESLECKLDVPERLLLLGTGLEVHLPGVRESIEVRVLDGEQYLEFRDASDLVLRCDLESVRSFSTGGLEVNCGPVRNSQTSGQGSTILLECQSAVFGFSDLKPVPAGTADEVSSALGFLKQSAPRAFLDALQNLEAVGLARLDPTPVPAISEANRSGNAAWLALALVRTCAEYRWHLLDSLWRFTTAENVTEEVCEATKATLKEALLEAEELDLCRRFDGVIVEAPERLERRLRARLLRLFEADQSTPGLFTPEGRELLCRLHRSAESHGGEVHPLGGVPGE